MTNRTPNDDSTPTHEDTAAQPPKDVTPTNYRKDSRTTMRPERDDDDEESYGPKYKYPPSWTREEKMSKEQAEYRQGKPFHRCGICSYYQSSACKIVRGYISPSMGCSYFSEKYDPQRFGVTILTRRK